jgi:1,4-alpha-glucan branching enzyme
VRKLWEKDDDQVLAFMRGNLVFVFNFNPSKSFDGYGILAPGGSYKIVLDTDRSEFGGYNNVDDNVEHLTQSDPLYAPAGVEWLKLYLPARTAIVLRKR